MLSSSRVDATQPTQPLSLRDTAKGVAVRAGLLGVAGSEEGAAALRGNVGPALEPAWPTESRPYANIQVQIATATSAATTSPTMAEGMACRVRLTPIAPK